MKDENDKSTFDLADILGEGHEAAELIVSKRYALVGHYQAVKPPTHFAITGRREFGSKTPDIARDCWQTPAWLFNYFNKQVKGGFEIDAAASDDNALCPAYFTEKNSAFKNTVHKGAKVWLNPPYSDITPWVEWAVDAVNNQGAHVYMLLPDDISTYWFRMVVDNAAEAYALLHNGLTGKDGKSGRVRFIHALTGEEGGSAKKGSWVFVMRPHKKECVMKWLDRTICTTQGESFF